MAAVMRTLESWLYFQKGKTRDALRTRIDAIVKASGAKTGLFGTIAYHTPLGEYPAPNTTPESVDLQGALAEVRDAARTRRRRCGKKSYVLRLALIENREVFSLQPGDGLPFFVLDDNAELNQPPAYSADCTRFRA